MPRITLESLLLADRVSGIGDEAWFFCASPDCDVVYYNRDDEVFTRGDLRVEVHQKEPGRGSVPVCYCFGHTPDTVEAEIDANGASTAVTDVTEKVRAGLCFCDRANPQGSCCLGNLDATVRAILARASTRRLEE